MEKIETRKPSLSVISLSLSLSAPIRSHPRFVSYATPRTRTSQFPLCRWIPVNIPERVLPSSTTTFVELTLREGNLFLDIFRCWIPIYSQPIQTPSLLFGSSYVFAGTRLKFPPRSFFLISHRPPYPSIGERRPTKIKAHPHRLEMDHPDTIRSYMEALEEERQKIEVFRRELPLCLELVKQAIVGCKLQLSGASTEVMLHGQSECNSEQTTTGAHVLEEFIPLKSSRSHDGDYVEEDDDVDNDDEEQHSQMKKSDWLRSVQLWNPSPDSTPKEGPARPPPPKKAPLPAAEAKNHRGSNGAFHPFNKDIKAAGGKINNSSNSDSKQQLSGGDASPAADRAASSTAGGGAGCGPKKEEKQGQRKQRRCWSQELHRRFLHALQQLGGSHATPKQIRELMRVDGLTNDEVKSHLQKYRLHVRRPSAPVQNVNTLAPQFVVVGGIWMSPQDFTAAAASTKSVAEVAAANGMYAPVATVPQPFKQLHKKPQSMMNSDERSCEEEGVDHHSHSPPTSTSTHTSAEC